MNRRGANTYACVYMYIYLYVHAYVPVCTCGVVELAAALAFHICACLRTEKTHKLSAFSHAVYLYPWELTTCWFFGHTTWSGVDYVLISLATPCAAVCLPACLFGSWSLRAAQAQHLHVQDSAREAAQQSRSTRSVVKLIFPSCSLKWYCA